MIQFGDKAMLLPECAAEVPDLPGGGGFEALVNNTPTIEPWSIIGDESSLHVMADRVSCFTKNTVALRMEVLCDNCPPGGVGIYNPGFWGMNIEEGKAYNLVMYIRSSDSVDLTASLTCSRPSSALQNLASAPIQDINVSNWTKVELQLLAQGTCRTARLDLTTFKRGVLWLDQVSLMPSDTYKGHGFRKELMHMLLELKPQFLRFPGGCFVEGNWLRNAFRWKETIGPWEERPGHYGDVWNYWTDDGLGYYEFLLLAEDLGTLPVWVFNAGISHNDGVNSSMVTPFVQDVFDGPDIQVVSNCENSSGSLGRPADLYDSHIYSNAIDVFLMKSKFDRTPRTGPKVFVSEYAVNEPKDAGQGNLLASLAEAALLTGLETNSDIVQMACYAPLFTNDNDRRWNPDAIVFNSWQHYGTPSYWMQTFFRESNGAMIHPVQITSSYSDSLAASAITWNDTENSFLRVKIVNFGSHAVNLTIRATGLQASTAVNTMASRLTVLTSSSVMDENSFSNPNNVVPIIRELPNAAEETHALLNPYSLTSFDLALEQKAGVV